MKTLLRVLGLSLSLGAAFYSPAEAVDVTCNILCPGIGRFSVPTTLEACCGGQIRCPGGGAAIPWSYTIPGSAPQHC